MEYKRLFRSEHNQVFAGVCGGLGEYAGVDPVLIRLLWVLATIFTGVLPGLVAYFIAILIMPRAPQPMVHHDTPPHEEHKEDSAPHWR